MYKFDPIISNYVNEGIIISLSTILLISFWKFSDVLALSISICLCFITVLIYIADKHKTKAFQSDSVDLVCAFPEEFNTLPIIPLNYSQLNSKVRIREESQCDIMIFGFNEDKIQMSGKGTYAFIVACLFVNICYYVTSSKVVVLVCIVFFWGFIYTIECVVQK